MSAHTVASLDTLREHAIVEARYSADGVTYTAGLRKAPRLIASAHLARVGLRLLVLAARHATGRTR